MGWTTKAWWFDSRHGEFFFPSRSLDRRCGPPSSHSIATPLHLLPPSAASLCLWISLHEQLLCAWGEHQAWRSTGCRVQELSALKQARKSAIVTELSRFSSVTPGELLSSIWNSSTAASYHIQSNSSVITHLTIRRYTAWTTDGAVTKQLYCARRFGSYL
jgi:hypothetical protein